MRRPEGLNISLRIRALGRVFDIICGITEENVRIFSIVL